MSLIKWIRMPHTTCELKQKIESGADVFEMDRNGCVPFDLAEKEDDYELLMDAMFHQLYLEAFHDNVEKFATALQILQDRTDVDLHTLSFSTSVHPCEMFLEMLKRMRRWRVIAYLVEHAYMDP